MSVLFVVALFGLMIFVIARAAKSNKTPGNGTLVPSEDIVEGSSLPGGKKTHTSPPVDDAVRVYLYESERQCWCCPNCQCENDDSRSSCCVCNHKK